MLYKTKLPSLEDAVVDVQQKLFRIGYTWPGGDTSASPRLTNCHLVINTETKLIRWIGRGHGNEFDFLKYPATFIQWHRLIQNEVVFQEYAEDTQLHENMVYEYYEGWKHGI